MQVARVMLGLTLTIMTIVLTDASAQADTRSARLEGIRLYRTGRYAEAIPYFEQVLARKNRDLEVLIKRGACYLQTNQPEKALADFDRVNQHSSWFSAAFGARGIFLTESTAVPQPPAWMSFAESWGNRGIALLMLGRNEEALDSFRTAVNLWNQPENRTRISSADGRAQLNHGRAAAYQGLGQAYYRVGYKDMAVQAYTEAIAIDASDPNAFAGRADVLTFLRLTDQALADYAEALRLDPTHARALAGRGIAYSDLGRDEAGPLRPQPGHRARSRVCPRLLAPRRNLRASRRERGSAFRLQHAVAPGTRRCGHAQGPRRAPCPHEPL